MGLDTSLHTAVFRPENKPICLLNEIQFVFVKELYSWRNNYLIRDYYEKKYPDTDLNNFCIKVTDEDLKKIKLICLNNPSFESDSTLEGFSNIMKENFKVPDGTYEYYIYQNW